MRDCSIRYGLMLPGACIPCLCAIVFLASMATLPRAYAENRALLVGVGAYRDRSIPDLKGIDADLTMMRDLAARLGFGPDRVRVLQDDEASYERVVEALRNWLTQGVGRDDRVLFFFSGHGTRVPDRSGDETVDRQDEALVMHDTRLLKRDGAWSLDRVLLDDELGDILQHLPAGQVLALVDACHSGTAFKSLNLGRASLGVDVGASKFYAWPGIHDKGGPGIAAGREDEDEGDTQAPQRKGLVYIAAAGDNEESIATARGSIFTRGVYEAVNRAVREGKALSPRQLTAQADRFIAGNVNPPRRFHPVLAADPALRDKPLPLSSPHPGHGPVWRTLEALVDRAAPLVLRLNRTRYLPGETLEVVVEIPREGYLNIIGVGPKDEPTVLFPNQFHEDNRVRKGTFVLPARKMDFELRAGAPYGPNMVVAFLGTRAINAYRDGIGARDERGDPLQPFMELSPGDRGSFKVMKVRRQLSGGVAYAQVCPRAADCPP